MLKQNHNLRGFQGRIGSILSGIPLTPNQWTALSLLVAILAAAMIVMDELFSGLSMAEVSSTIPIIEKLQAEGKTLIMIEHRLRELFRIVDRVMVMNYGRKIAEGTPKEVMESEEVKQAYLGTE